MTARVKILQIEMQMRLMIKGRLNRRLRDISKAIFNVRLKKGSKVLIIQAV